MLVMIACGLLLAAGVYAAVLWSGLSLTVPERPERPERQERSGPPPVREVLARYLWWVTLTTATGLAAGLLVAGAGGRLIMRLLAATSSDARGAITEAGETVGRISLGGTISLIIFGGLLGGLLSALIYVLIRPWLPPGRWGALAFGLLLLLALSTRLEPLRANNPDFVLVGPAALALVTFGLLAIAHGAAVVGIAGRYSRALPLLDRHPRTWLRYAPVLPLVVVPPLALAVIVVGVLVVLGSRLPGLPTRMPRRLLIPGRVALGLAAIAASPGFVVAVIDIA